MRRLGLALLTVVVSAMVGAATVSASAPSPFEGTWSSVDPVDGSTQHLSINGGSNVQLTYVDEYGTTCELIGAPTMVFTGRLTGSIQVNDLFAVFKQGACGNVHVLGANIQFGWTFEYDPETDTMYGAIQDGPATWHRD